MTWRESSDCNDEIDLSESCVNDTAMLDDAESVCQIIKDHPECPDPDNE